MLEPIQPAGVIAFPSPRPWWKFWAPRRPHLLREGIDFVWKHEVGGVTAHILGPRKQWNYTIAFVKEVAYTS